MSDHDCFWREESLRLTACVLELEQQLRSEEEKSHTLAVKLLGEELGRERMQEQLERQARIARQMWARWAAAMSRVIQERDVLRKKIEQCSAVAPALCLASEWENK